MSKSVNFIKRLLCGIIIGGAAVTPGISGGVIAASYGIYEPSVYAITGFIRNPVKSMKWLFPIAFGVICGVLCFARVIMHLIEINYDTLIVIFCGFVIGNIPALIKEAKKGIKIFAIILTAVFVFTIFIYLSTYIPVNCCDGFPLVVKLVIIGIVVSIGTVIPGISSSFILMNLGLYDMYIAYLGGGNIFDAIIILITFVIVSLLIFKGSEILFKNFRGYAYSATVGIIASSALAVFPDISILTAGHYVLFVLSLVIGYLLV